MDEPVLSIVIVNRNACGVLGECLASIRAHPPGRPHEVVIVDNASSDGSQAMARDRFPDARWLGLSENAGFAAACNRGADLARGRCLLLLNPDTRVTAGALDAMLDAIEADPGVGVVGCRQVDERGRPQLACGRDPTLWREFLRRRDTLGLARGDARAVRRVEGRYAGPSDVDWVTGACLMTRKDVYAELGGMDEAFWLYFEDAEFCRRVRASGRRVVYLPAATIIHLRGAVADTVRPLSGAAYRAGQLAYASKHRGRAGAALARLWCLARSGLAALVPPRGMTRREGRWVAAQLMRLAILGRPSADWRSGPAGVDSPPHRR